MNLMTFRWADLFRRPTIEATHQRSLVEAELALEDATQAREYYMSMEKMLTERIARLRRAV